MPQKQPILNNWLNTGNVITIILSAVAGLWFLATMNSALAVQSEKSARNAAEIERVARENKERWDRVEASMSEIRADIKTLLLRPQGDRR